LCTVEIIYLFSTNVNEHRDPMRPRFVVFVLIEHYTNLFLCATSFHCVQVQ
jgi:hypothetical protein